MDVNNIVKGTISTLKDMIGFLKVSLEHGDRVNLLVESEAGIGKSQVIQQLAKEIYGNDNFIDLRLALLERPDLSGLMYKKRIENCLVTSFAINEMLPQSGSGILCFEEINRADVSVTNTIMQLLTESRINKTDVGKGWLFVALINPDTKDYQVNVLDAALDNRFVRMKLEYSKNEFLEYIKKNDWDYRIINFVEAGLFEYKPKSECNNNDYISPRTFEYLHRILKHNKEISNQALSLISKTVLGINLGTEFFKFSTDNKPVLYADIKNNTKDAISQIKVYCSDKNYRGDLLRVTCREIADNYNDINKVVLNNIINVMPLDLVKSLILQIVQKNQIDINDIISDKNILKRLVDINNTVGAVC